MDSYDLWKTTEPERDSKCKCVYCGCELYECEEYYDIEGEILCEDCARGWLDEHRRTVTYEMEKGE